MSPAFRGGDATRRLDAQVARVLARDACSGCGLCQLLDPGLEMRLDEAGFLRPRRVREGLTPADAARRFARSCPGVRVGAPVSPGSREHPTMGSYVGVWVAHATDPQIRFTASSGGALTALHAWLVQTGRATRVLGAAAATGDQRRTVPVSITTREEALRAAGSRYAPVGTLTGAHGLGKGEAVTGKPCEIAALRALGEHDRSTPSERPLLLSFFCAGTPSQRSTEDLLARTGLDPERPVDELRYRGGGWPGGFRARQGDRMGEADYATSWGQILGRTVQWRCKICPDGIGQSADIVAADLWETDRAGYPLFEERDGVSALIARTQRGLEIVELAARAGVLTLRQIPMQQLANVQPLQDERRRLLLARILGAAAAGRRAPRYRGFGLAGLTVRRPRLAARVARGSWRRVRAARHSGTGTPFDALRDA